MSAVRCFVGVPLPLSVTEPIATAVRAIQDADRAWRDEKWVPAENLHLTLKFLGDVDETAVTALAEAIGDAVAAHQAFELPMIGLRAIPQPRRCRMVWASFLDPDGACAALAEGVERAALGFGIAAEQRAFVPHATVCRARRPKPLSETALEAGNAVLNSVNASVSVPSVTVFSSRLTPRGPIYSAIGARSLRGD